MLRVTEVVRTDRRRTGAMKRSALLNLHADGDWERLPVELVWFALLYLYRRILRPVFGTDDGVSNVLLILVVLWCGALVWCVAGSTGWAIFTGLHP